MKVLRSSIFWGVLMAVAGGLLMLEVLGIVAAGGLIWSVLFGVGFVYVFFRSRENWWAIIPGGALLTLALVAGLSATVGGMASAALFFGLALTFALLAALPTEAGQIRWPIISAGVPGVLVGIGAGAELRLAVGAGRGRAVPDLARLRLGPETQAAWVSR